MDKIRLLYRHVGRAVWPSHLDTMRTLQRAMNRAGIPIRYSEGFNPHAYISILMPLSVGTESICQIAEIRVKEDQDLSQLPVRLTAALPEGLEVIQAYEDGRKPVELKWMDVEGFWEYDSIPSVEAAENLQQLFSAPLEVMRKTKHGEGLFRLTDHIQNLSFLPENNGVRVTARISCNEPVVNPELLTSAVRQHLPDYIPDGGHFCRMEVFSADGQVFR